MRSSSGLGILLKSLKRRNDGFQIGDLRTEGCGAFAEDLVEFGRRQLARAHQIFNRELQREKRIFELVRQTPRQLAPSRNALALHEPFALAGELARSCD